MLLKKLYEKGGPGSGNFGHAGRPGQVGGSASTGTGGALTGTQREDRRSTAEREQGSSKKSSVREFSRNTGKQLGIKVKVNSKAKAAGIAVHLNAIESQIESAKSVYPELDNVLINGSYPTDLAINVEQIGGNPKFRDDKGRIAPMSVDACYTHSRGEITLAPFVIGTRDFERTTMTAANSTFCRDTVDNGVASVFMHELGHKVGHCMSKKSQQMFMNFLSREKSNVGSHVSRYAADSASEAFAECFAMTVHPGFKNLMKQSKWHRDMYDVMQKVIGASVKKKSVPSMLQLFKGGPGSGNFGHSGRPGQVGGSMSSEAAAAWAAGDTMQENRPKPSPSAKPEPTPKKIKLEKKPLKEVIEMYHGTVSSAEQSIREFGLIPKKGKGADTFAVEHGYTIQNLASKEHQMSVFMTKKPLYAERFANYATYVAEEGLHFTPVRPIILKLRIPKKEFEKNFVKDEFYSKGYRTTKPIPPEWIGDTIYKSNDDVTIYVVVLVDESKQEKGGPGSGNFGHAGRPGQVGGSGSGTGGGGASSDSDSFGSGSQFHERKPSTTRVDRKGRVLTRLDSLDKDKLPPHLKKLRIRPDLTDVYVNLDPKGDLLATGRDSKGRPQPVYSDKFKKHQQKEKHTRVIKLEKKFDEAERDYKADQKSKDYHKKERADCLALIIDTGIRPGSERDTKADKKAYGATTLEGRHVVQRGGQTLLVFEAKCGVHQELPVTDPKVASMVVKRAQKAGPNGKLFDCNDSQLRSYTKKLDGGGFKPKDMRTLKANTTAIKVIKKEYGSSKPKTKKEFKKRVKFVGTEVSKVLGNTCSVALQSYIRPEIFTVWGAW